jgi:WD40 repeat protein
MRKTAFLLGLVFIGILGTEATAGDLPRAARPAKEPKYTHALRYFQLVFGPDAGTRLWCVFDGDQVLYVDRNGNGDLTEQGERFALDPKESQFSVPAGREIRAFEGHTNGVNSVALSPDGRLLASGDQGGTVILWEEGTGRQRAVLAPPEGKPLPVVLAFAPDGKTLASAHTLWPANSAVMTWWNVQTGKARASFKISASVADLAFAPDGRTLALGCGKKDSGEIQLWDVGPGKERAAFKGHTRFVPSVAFAPDGKTLASASFDRTIKLWDVVTERLRGTLEGHTQPVRSVAFVSGAKTLASASWDKTIRLWDVSDLLEADKGQ